MPRTRPNDPLEEEEIKEEGNDSSTTTPSAPEGGDASANEELSENSEGASADLPPTSSANVSGNAGGSASTSPSPVFPQAPNPAPAAPDLSNSVILSKEDFEALMGRLAAVESKTNIEAKEPQKRNVYRQVKVRFIEGEVVVGYGKSWEEKQVDGDKKLILEVFTGGVDGKAQEKKRHLVKFVEYHEEGEFEMADIIKVHEHYDEKSYGQVAKSKLTKDQWNMEETGEYVESVVRIPNFIYELRLADGRSFALHQSALN